MDNALSPRLPFATTTPTPAVSKMAWPRVTVAVLCHVFLGLLLADRPLLATAHALIIFVIALVCAMRKPYLAAYWAAYIIGAEVLWRMNHADVFWEFSKYAVSAVFLIALLRLRITKGNFSSLFYFLLLLPSTIMLAMNETFFTIRTQVSFNLSGPLSLMVCTLFFSRMALTQLQFTRLLLYLICPIVATATLTAAGTIGATNIVFVPASIFETSGGFGPNQVASILGLGACACFLFHLNLTARSRLNFIMIGLLVLFMIFAVLTFSRGGSYVAVASMFTAWFLLLTRSQRHRAKILFVAVVLFGLAHFLIVPMLDSFTGGFLRQRFSDTNPTGRDDLFWADLKIWQSHPLLGVGPGEAIRYRSKYTLPKIAHTEFSRSVAEHGVFGAVSLLILFWSAFRVYQNEKLIQLKAIRASLIVWALLFMAVNAMRLAAPSFLFGLAFLKIADTATSRLRARS